MNLPAIWTVFRFECRRTMTVPRLLVWAGLACFPFGLLTLVQSQGANLREARRAEAGLFILIPEVVCIMGLLLWAAPVVYSELEGKTWTYIAISPAGKASVLIGKYLNAIVWTALTAWLSLSLSMLVAYPPEDALRVFRILVVLVALSCAAYGAVYVFLGVVFLRRALVAAVGYTFVSEVLIGFIPAIINQFTIQYHLRSLLMKWMEWTSTTEQMGMGQQFISNAPPWQHVISLLGFTVILLFLAIVVLRRRELVLADTKV